jgi:hypothetical protein
VEVRFPARRRPARRLGWGVPARGCGAAAGRLAAGSWPRMTGTMRTANQGNAPVMIAAVWGPRRGPSGRGAHRRAGLIIGPGPAIRYTRAAAGSAAGQRRCGCAPGAERNQAEAPVRVSGGEQGAGLPAPGVAHPVNRLPDTEMIEDVDVDGGAGAVDERERVPHRRAATVIRPVDDHKPALGGQRRNEQVPGGGVDEQAVPQHRREAVVRYRNPLIGGRGSR